jgi:hypothetical protein
MNQLAKVARTLGRRGMRGPATLSEDVIRAMRVAADPVDFAAEQRKLDAFMGRDVAEGPSFEGITLPEDDIAPMVGATGAPRSWLERAQFEEPLTASLREDEIPPLMDMLRTADRSRSLVSGRLDRLTPEQQASSLQFVGRQASRDADATAAAARQGRAEQAGRNLLAAITAAEAAGLGAAGVYKAYEDGAVPGPPEFSDDRPLEDYLPEEMDIGEEPLDLPIGMPDMPVDLNPDYGIADAGLRTEDIMGMLQDPDIASLPFSSMSPEEAVSLSPGPSQDVPLPGVAPEQRQALQSLVNQGIGYSRAVDILSGRAKMTRTEYEMVTGGRN